jgi:hypothetical protein
MRFARPYVSVFLSLVVAIPLFAQQATPTPQRDLQAVTAVQGALTALGGTAQPTPTTIVGSGTYTRFLAGSSISYALRVEVSGFDKFRWQVDTPDLGTVTTVVSGTASWSQSAEGTEQIPVGEIPGKTLESFPVLALANWTNSATVGLKMVGSETIAGEAVYHITVTPTLSGNTDPKRESVYETTHQREVYLDQQTNLPVRLRYYRHPIDWRVGVAVDVEYSNFQTVGGISFPMTITTYLGDKMLTQMQFQALNLNTSVAESDFVQGATQ